jgi:hypothetical protein
MTDRELDELLVDAIDSSSWEMVYKAQQALRERLAQPEWVGLTDEEFEEYAHWIYPEKLIELENLLKEKNTCRGNI